MHTAQSQGSKKKKENTEKENTVGLEIEIHAISSLNKAQSKQYDERLKLEKKGRVIKELGLTQEFSNEASVTSHLCIVQKKNTNGEYVDFMSVAFDDNSSKTRLEFESINTEQNGGIQPYSKFFAKQNTQDVRNAVQEFPAAMKQLKQMQVINHDRAINSGEFNFIFPPYAHSIFMESKFSAEKIKNSGAIHVTHSLSLDKNANSRGFVVYTNPKSQRATLSQNKRNTILEMPQNLQGQLIGKTYNNNNRTHYSPNPKTPKEFIEECKSCLYPMSNTIEGVTQDIKTYQEVAKLITTARSNLGPNDQETDAKLQAAQEKINNTIKYIQQAINEARKAAALSGKYDEKNFPAVCLFPSLEYKLKHPLDNGNAILVEHHDSKIGSLNNFLYQAIVLDYYDKDQYKEICQNFSTIAPAPKLQKQVQTQNLIKPNPNLQISNIYAEEDMIKMPNNPMNEQNYHSMNLSRRSNNNNNNNNIDDDVTPSINQNLINQDQSINFNHDNSVHNNLNSENNNILASNSANHNHSNHNNLMAPNNLISIAANIGNTLNAHHLVNKSDNLVTHVSSQETTTNHQLQNKQQGYDK